MKTVVVGAGAAGLWAALHATERGSVTVVAPDPTRASSTSLAQGGIAAAVAEGDDPAAHAADTLSAGAGLNDPVAVRVLTDEAPAAIAELRYRGMVFDEGGAPTMEGGHRVRRVLHAGGDATGWAILEALLDAAHREPGVEFVDDRAGSLLADGKAIVGVRTIGGLQVESDRVVLATGGATGIFGRRTGPDRATGDGLAMAWDSGAAVADLEFVQFHPTALDVPGQPARLLTEALRGEGAVLLDSAGARFMHRFNQREELAPRDIVARAIARVGEETGGQVFLDATGVTGVAQRFPTAAGSCAEAGLDIARDRIPVAPAAHYFTGGVLTDLWGRTTLPGLYACGEVACTGVHGANRLASNSLLEALVFGRRAGSDGGGPPLELPVGEEPIPQRVGVVALDEVRSLADRFLGVIRTGSELETVAAKLQGSGTIGSGDRPATLVATLLAEAAFRRRESRGGHYRSDFPETRLEWRVRQVVSTRGWVRLPVPA